MTRFCRLRRFLGLTQLDLEIATGIPVRRISLAEHGSIRLTEPEESAVFEYLAARLRIVRELEAAHVSDPASRAVVRECINRFASTGASAHKKMAAPSLRVKRRCGPLKEIAMTRTSIPPLSRTVRNTIPAEEERLDPPVFIRIPQIHRAPDEFDRLPDALPDPSLGWVENPERKPRQVRDQQRTGAAPVTPRGVRVRP